MPHISAAMAASLRRSSGWLGSRSITDDANNFKNSFSSWDNCMSAAYCKWPVVAAIIIAGLIVLSVVVCIVRCACCGMSCCCSCFSCLQCCGNCCGCCDPPAGRKHKHLEDPYYPPNQGYKAQAPMMSGGVAPPQYAQFEVGPNGLFVEPKISDDALPPMPSWDTAAKKHVPVDAGDTVELGELDPKTGQQVPLMTGAGSASRSGSPINTPAHSPYGDLPGQGQGQGQGHQAAYMGAGSLNSVGQPGGVGSAANGMRARRPGSDPYNRNPSIDSRGGYNERDIGYGPVQPTSPLYGPEHNAGYPPEPTQGFGHNEDFSYNNDNGPVAFGIVTDNYSRGQGQYQSQSDSGRPFLPSQPSRNYSQDSNRPLVAANQRTYSTEDPYSRNRQPPSPPKDNGFEYGSSSNSRGALPSTYNRQPSPPTSNYNRRPSPPLPRGDSYSASIAPSYATRDPMLQQNSGSGYQGYRSYGGPSQTRGPPAAFLPNGRAPIQGRDEQGWNDI